eukprot:645691-Lingulodinium_polyedra.AAC.1
MASLNSPPHALTRVQSHGFRTPSQSRPGHRRMATRAVRGGLPGSRRATPPEPSSWRARRPV